MQSIEENDEMNVRTRSARCLILISACQKPGKKNINNNWQTKETINSEAKSDIKEWEKAVKISSRVT